MLLIKIKRDTLWGESQSLRDLVAILLVFEDYRQPLSHAM